MAQTILTKYLPATNHHGSRVKASYQARDIILSWDDELDVQANHDIAAKMLLHMMKWDDYYNLSPGRGLPDNRGYAYVPIKKAS